MFSEYWKIATGKLGSENCLEGGLVGRRGGRTMRPPTPKLDYRVTATRTYLPHAWTHVPTFSFKQFYFVEG